MSVDSDTLRRLTSNDKTLTELKFDSNSPIGDRWGIFSATPVERLAKALFANHTITSLYLPGQKLTHSDLKIIMRAIKTHHTITSLDLSLNKLSIESGQALAEMLKVNTVLVSLDLGKCELDASKGTTVDKEVHVNAEGAIAIAEALKVNRSLQELNLSCNTLGAKGSKAMAEALRVNDTLTILKLESCFLEEKGSEAIAEALKVNRSLLQLNLRGNKLRARVFVVAEMLKVNRSLQKLDLGDNEFSEFGGKAVAEALQINGSLTALDLGEERENSSPHFRNQLGVEGGIAIAEALKVNCSLLQLNLRTNYISLKGSIAIAEALKINHSLTVLDLGANGLGAEGNIAIAEALKVNRSLRELYLNKNGSSFSTEGEVKALAKALAEALKVNGSLTKLDLGDNGFSELGGIAEALKINRSLQKLDLRGHNLFATGKEIAEALKVNRSLIELNLHRSGFNACTTLAEALKVNGSLTKLDLSSNYMRGEPIAEALKVNRSLIELDLGDIVLGEEARAIAEALKVNRSLQQLNLHYTRLGAEEGKAIAEALKVNETLTVLDYSDNKISAAVSQAIDRKLAQNKQRVEKQAQEAKEKATKAVAIAEPSVKQKSVPLALASQVNTAALGITKTQIGPQKKEPSSVDVSTPTIIDDYIPKNEQQLVDNRTQVSKEKERQNASTVVAPLVKQEPRRVSAPQMDLSSQTTPQNPVDLQKKERASLDDATVQKLQKLSAKSAEILEAAEKLQIIDVIALQALQGQALQLKRLFDGDAKAEHASAERKRIEADPDLATYHRFFARLLTGTWLACQSINSGLVENTEKFTSDRVGQGLDAIGKHIPIISAVTSFFTGAISKWNDRERHQGVQKIASLFPDLDSAFRGLGTLARQATLAQESALKQLPTQATGFIGRVKQRAQDLKAAILADDVDTPLKRKAVTDCQTLLTAIRDGRPHPNPTVADLLTILMGTGYVYTASHQPSSPPPALSPTPSPQTPSSPSMTMGQMIAFVQQQAAEMKRLQERDEARDREFKAWKQRMSPQDNETEVPGDSEMQLQIKASSVLNRDAARQSAPIFGAVARLEDQVTRLTHQMTVVEVKQQETEDTVAVTNARVDRLAKKKTSKSKEGLDQ